MVIFFAALPVGRCYFARGLLLLLGSWACCRGLAPPPAPRRPARPGASDFTAVCGWRWSKMRQSVFADLPAFLRKDWQKTLPRLAALGQDNCVVPPQCSPPDPLFTAGGVRVGVRYCTLRLFYSSWDCRWGNTGQASILGVTHCIPCGTIRSICTQATER